MWQSRTPSGETTNWRKICIILVIYQLCVLCINYDLCAQFLRLLRLTTRTPPIPHPHHTHTGTMGRRPLYHTWGGRLVWTRYTPSLAPTTARPHTRSPPSTFSPLRQTPSVLPMTPRPLNKRTASREQALCFQTPLKLGKMTPCSAPFRATPAWQLRKIDAG